jgi:hypothetical protein
MIIHFNTLFSIEINNPIVSFKTEQWLNIYKIKDIDDK